MEYMNIWFKNEKNTKKQAKLRQLHSTKTFIYEIIAKNNMTSLRLWKLCFGWDTLCFVAHTWWNDTPLFKLKLWQPLEIHGENTKSEPKCSNVLKQLQSGKSLASEVLRPKFNPGVWDQAKSLQLSHLPISGWANLDSSVIRIISAQHHFPPTDSTFLVPHSLTLTELNSV